ncbi:MAG TPA: Hpt domain-containing protein [Candidatus Limnocylindria bacterium]|jgi:HPt (histidine-containing phosphotransfer) domain-containing protein|nr:Hpt domain-containing protein [Candidatus Limnocylindria bacterium]
MPNETLATLASELGSESVVELIEAYLADTPARLDEIAQMMASGDQTALRRAAHSLKGSSSIFGVHAIEKAALALEIAAANGDKSNQPALFARLTELYPAVQAELQQAVAEFHAAA